jgi:non-catalytic primase subunit PriX-like protein
MWSGNGYHIIQPVECPTLLENIQQFQKFDNPSQEFLRFVKDFLSNGKADKNSYPSFRSCLLRVPHSFNAKCIAKDGSFENSKVKIIQKWNGYRSPISEELLENFQTNLIQKKIDEYNYRQKILKARRYYTNNNNIVSWIEKLLNTPIADFRKNALSLILAPYLIHIKKLSYQESFDILSEWLKRCNSIRELGFINSSDQQVKSALNTAIKKRILPMKLETLKNKNLELYKKFYK